MFCSKCGFKNEENATFCGGCGQAVKKNLNERFDNTGIEPSDVVPVTYSRSEEPTNSEEPQTVNKKVVKRRRLFVIIPLVTVVIAVVVSITVYFALKPGRNEDNNTKDSSSSHSNKGVLLIDSPEEETFNFEFLNPTILLTYDEEEDTSGNGEELLYNVFTVLSDQIVASPDENYSLALPQEIAEKEIEDYFGLEMAPREKLSNPEESGILYKNGYYCIPPGSYYDVEHTVEAVYKISDELYRVECVSIRRGPGIREPFKTESIIRKNPESKYGYNLVSRSLR